MDEKDDREYSRTPQIQDLVRICQSLNEHEARYVLIGGFAVIAHGAGRTTKDIDLLIDASAENVSRVKAGLAILDDNAAADVEESDVERYSVVRIADEVIVDLLAKACGVMYKDAARDQEHVEIDGVTIPIASKRTLIRTKDTIRPSDAADKQFLQELIDAEERDE
ncbi:MAG TPA: nucleotidyltransferase [Vicinamibacteria bacterium]|nr:nucleotidyltransferase [Vicinamibacteria bacterium]